MGFLNLDELKKDHFTAYAVDGNNNRTIDECAFAFYFDKHFLIIVLNKSVLLIANKH